MRALCFHSRFSIPAQSIDTVKPSNEASPSSSRETSALPQESSDLLLAITRIKDPPFEIESPAKLKFEIKMGDSHHTLLRHRLLSCFHSAHSTMLRHQGTLSFCLSTNLVVTERPRVIPQFRVTQTLFDPTHRSAHHHLMQLLWCLTMCAQIHPDDRHQSCLV